MSRFALTAAALLLLGACSTQVNFQSSAPVPADGLLPVGNRGAMCYAEAQRCDTSHTCCDGMTCSPNGRLGMLCRRPFPG